MSFRAGILRFATAVICMSGALVLAGGTAQAQSPQSPRPETVIGTVKSDSGVAIANASITVTPAGAGFSAAVTVRSSTTGRWTATIPNRAPEYYVTVSAIGWIQSRTTVKSAGPDAAAPVSVDIALKRAPVRLQTVQVTADRRQPPQRDFIAPDVAQTEKGILASSEVFAVADQGDLMGMIAQVPGITVTSDPSTGLPQFSVLGLPGSQNNITLNGLAFGGTDVPRDIIGAVRVSASAYDVSRGGFSGAQLSVTQAPGNNFVNQILHATFDAPGLQATDRVGQQLGQRYANTQLSGGFSGPIVFDRLFYNVSAQAGRRFSDLSSLLTGDPATLAGLGISRDSVSALTAAIQARGIPVSASNVPDRRETDNASVLARFDFTPSQSTDASITTSLRHSKSLASFVSATALPDHGGDLSRNGGDVTGEFLTYFDSLVLNVTRLGAHTDATTGMPYTLLPDARVLVTSQLADGSTGLASLVFGGNAALPRDSRASGAEFYNQTSWNTIDNKHRFRLTADARLDRLTQTEGANARGTFTYNSIADIEANQPASFSRSFASHDMAADVETASLALGDQWRATQRISVTYGLRVDANAVGTALAYNPRVDSIFGLRTDHAPREAVLSPRASFSWGIGNNGTTGIPGFGAPWGILSGGIGEFRNDLRPGLIAPVVTNTGLADALGQLLCVGSAVPVPDYTAYMADQGAIPTTCADGGQPSFISNRPNVWAIDPSFQSQRSWRGNLTLRGPFITKLFRFAADATYSLNLHQQSPVDVNFTGVQRAALNVEGERPVYASPSSIVPATGAVTNVDSRVSPLYGGVNDLRSDLESRAAQYTFTLQPIGLSTQNARWTISYVYSDLREQTRGFGATTAGDPRAVEWSRGALGSKHAVNLNLYMRVHSLFSMALTGRASSGLPFTPIVAGDVNGDGLSNDRAFVFNPATADPTIAAGMSQLLAGASSRVKHCLTRQVGTIAGRNSCEGPWTATAAATLTLNPEKLGWDNRTTISLNISNPFAGIDELVHGSAHMQGWGQPATPDPTLLRVRGYDPAANAFRYEVNQRFGDTRFASSSLRLPFILSLEAKVRLGGDVDHQGLANIIGPGRTRRGARRTPQQIRIQLLQSIFNPLQGILQAKDSLSILSQQQIDRLTQLQRRLIARQDSIWAPVVKYIDAMPDNYNLDEAVELVRPARMAAYDAMVDAMIEVGKILTPEQIADFPPALRSSFDIESLRAQRPTKGFFPAY
ncbi:MAG TPA: TonB-dependent receptor [Gemmatimonadaceae bacterium]|nr:TonB-dependent receptor [Gemmatimonadaceae bacterium]